MHQTFMDATSGTYMLRLLASDVRAEGKAAELHSLC